MITHVLLVIASAFFVLAMRLAVGGILPSPLAGIVVTGSFVLLVVALFRALARTRAISSRPLLERHGFWLVTLAALLTLPMLGAFSLVDPWETHYAEVAREMIERRDPISLWWANEGWFRSKPVLTFWLEASSMLLFGVRTTADHVISGSLHPEWAVRFPAAALAIVGSYGLYYGVSRTCGRRAGFVGGLALWSMPGFALVSHQAITDMPLIASIAAALGLSMRALHTPDARQAPKLARAGLAALVGVGSFAQLAMLVLDRGFATGSPGNCGLPGQPACARVAYAHPAMHGWMLALCFAPLAGWAITAIAEERRSARLFAIASWVAASFGVMAKGPAALVIPGAAVAITIIRSPRALLRFEIPTGLALAVLLVAPWYLAGYARHGRAFLDEVVMRNMLGRTLDHLHDTNDGVDTGIGYYVRQFGYATFPWCGIAAAAAFSLRPALDRSRRGSAKTLLYAATLASFVLVTAMRTKFHHYILVALPSAAMLAGIWVDERIADRPGSSRCATTAASLFGALAVLGIVARDLVMHPALVMQLFTYRYDRRWIHAESLAVTIAVFAALAAVGLLAFAIRRRGAAFFVAAGLAASAFFLDVYLVRAAPDGGQGKLIAAFYRDRATRPSAAPLLAYQLNWKGENFYTGNHVAIFVRSGAPMRTWIDARRATGDRTIYAVTERGRIANLERELGTHTELISTEDDSAEFALVRADY